MQRVDDGDEHPRDLCECGHRRANHRSSGPLEGSCSVTIRELVGRTSKKADGLDQWREGCRCARFVLGRSHHERQVSE